MTVVLDGESLTIEELARIARDGAPVERHPATHAKVARGEALIAQVVENYRRAYAEKKAPPTEYGVTTGFGEFKDKPIAPEELEQLQRNLLEDVVHLGRAARIKSLAARDAGQFVECALAFHTERTAHVAATQNAN